MWTRKHTPRTRGFRPETDVLEGRQLLSAVVSGTDSKGDTWTLRLIGPGQLSVTKQSQTQGGAPSSLTSATDIKTITIGGTDPLTSRLVGTVTPGPNSDGRVFFDQLNELPAKSERYPGSGVGILAIEMPNFWLGDTTPAGQTSTAAPMIFIPDGAETLQFGGVDTTFNQQPTTSSSTSTNDLVTMGLPVFGGTRILINKSVSSTQTAPAAAGSPTTTPTTIQHGVTFAVSGRLNLFQANSIDGDGANPPGQFSDFNDPTASPPVTATGSGGTTLVSSSIGTTLTSAYFPNVAIKGSGTTGQIGDVRVGGNATNFTTFVFDPTNSGGDKVSNFSVGGQTDNVLLVAPSGSRNVVFGQGMNTVEIFSHVINSLQANAGAVNSNVFVDRSISRVTLGGDVVDTKILAGYNQNYTTILGNITGTSTGTPSAPATPSGAQPYGGMTLHVAGSVTNSVFAASVEPFQNNYSVFGDPNQVALTGGRISSKIEGTVDNSTIAPNTPKQAVFAATVDALAGPVVPPNVPQAPYPGVPQPTHLPGIPNLNRQLIKLSTPTTKASSTSNT